MGRFGGFQDDRSGHTVIHANFQPIWSYMASKSQLFYVFRKTDISKYSKWPSKPSILSRASPGHLHYFFLDISPTYFSKMFFKKSKTENPKRRAPENDRDLSFQKLIWSHMGAHGTPWDPHGDPIDFGFSGRPRERPTKTTIGRQGRISRLPEGCLRAA